jgi:hypothetical protein
MSKKTSLLKFITFEVMGLILTYFVGKSIGVSFWDAFSIFIIGAMTVEIRDAITVNKLFMEVNKHE